MLNDSRPCSLAELRKVLGLAFNDADLDAFCLDHFEEVYDRFGRGLQKPEKLTLLLDHCRAPERFHSLLQAMHSNHYTKFEAFFVEKKIAVACGQIEAPISPLLADYDVSMPLNFDLTEVVIKCLDSVFDKQGLIGFLVPCPSIVLMNNLCKRLKLEWIHTKVDLKPLISINALHTEIERAIFTITKRYILTLQKLDVILPVHCSEKDAIEPFWQNLCTELHNETLENRLVIVMSVHDSCVNPDGVVKLGRPDFSRAHVQRWVRQIVHNLQWPDDFVQTWATHIVAECSYENQLQIDWVYDYLQTIGNLLKKRPSLETLQQELGIQI